MIDADASADPVLHALDELMRVARENMANWLAVMERVEQTRELRRQGVPYSQMRIDTQGPRVMEAVSHNQERLTAAAAALRRALAHTLVAEGMSHADVARLFGVSRQRVGMLLRDDEGETPVAPSAGEMSDPGRPDAADPATE